MCRYFFLFAWLICLSSQAVAQTCDVAPGSLDPPGRPPIRLALLVGIGEYPDVSGIRKLTGPRNDVAAMTELLAGRFTFRRENIRVLLDGEASREAILDSICRHLIGRARAGDAVILYYSGHGSRMGDLPPIDEPDGYDETIVPVDSRTGNVQDIRDDEIRALIDRLATDNVTLVLDSCNSGTAARASAVARFAKPDLRFPPPEIGARAVEVANRIGVRGARYVLITGARAEQLSFEQTFPEGVHGVMTYFLVRALREAPAGATYREVFEAMAARVAADFPAQAPQLEGDNASRQLFLDSSVVPPHYVDAAPRGNGVVISAGSVHGVTAGSRYSVYPPGMQDFSPANAVAAIEVTSVMSFSAEARVLSGGLQHSASRASETLHNYRDQKLKVIVNIPRDALQAVSVALGATHNIEFVEPAVGGDLSFRSLVVDPQVPDPEFALLFPDGTQASPGLWLSQTDFAARLAQQLQAWSRWFGVLRLQNTAAKLNGALELIGPPGRSVQREGEEAGRLVLQEGDQFTIKVRNKSPRSVFVHVIDLASDGSITPIFPEAGSATAIAEGGEWAATYVARDGGRAVVRDTVKVILSTDAIRIQGFVQPGARPVAQNAMEVLFDKFVGARNIGHIDLTDWITLERSLVVKRRS